MARIQSACIAVLLLAVAAAADAQGATPVVQTTYGPVVGVVNGDINVYHSIPFATPPLGELRFKPPVPPTPWTATKDVSAPPPACSQDHILSTKPTGQEDCLYINVYTPNSASTTPLPVVFWIYGGGFVEGDSWKDGAYDGVKMATDHNVVVVAANYRLGAFGMLALPELQAETSDGTTGNMALLDQTLALHWVQDNIAKFGGDPSKVAIFGQSAGGFSVCWHLVSTTSKGLFSAAIMESGTCDSRSFFTHKEQAFAFGAEFAASVGCSGTGADRLACLRSLTVDDILKSNQTSSVDLSDVAGMQAAAARAAAAHSPLPATTAGGQLPPSLRPVMPWGPVIDDVVLLKLPLISLQEGDFTKVPIIFGTNKNDGSIFVPLISIILPGTHFPPNDGDMEAMLHHFFQYYSTNATAMQHATTEVMARYPLSAYKEDAWHRAGAVMTDWFFTCGTRRSAQAIAASGGDVWLYQFTQKLPWVEYDIAGDYHSAELPLVFDVPNLLHPFNSDVTSLSAAMETYWTNMARYGSPNSPSVGTQWPQYMSSTNFSSIALEWPLVVQDQLMEDTCNFWDGILKELHAVF